MKGFQELIEACKGLEDPESIHIVLRVIPTEINIRSGLVSFYVLLRDKLDMNDQGSVRQFEYDVNFDLPIEAIHLALAIDEKDGEI